MSVIGNILEAMIPDPCGGAKMVTKKKGRLSKTGFVFDFLRGPLCVRCRKNKKSGGSIHGLYRGLGP